MNRSRFGQGPSEHERGLVSDLSRMAAGAQHQGHSAASAEEVAQVPLGHRADHRPQKNDGLLARNELKGIEGDVIHAVLCGAGHNLRLILTHLRVLLLAPIEPLVLTSASCPAPLRKLRSAA